MLTAFNRICDAKDSPPRQTNVMSGFVIQTGGLVVRAGQKTGGNRSESCLNLFFNLRINILCS